MKWTSCLLLLAALGCGQGATAINTKIETPGSLVGRSTYAFTDAPELHENGFVSGHLFNPIMQRRIRDELGKALKARGYTEAPAEVANVLVSVSGGRRQDVVTQGDQKGETVRGIAYTLDRGALVIHFIDPQSKQVLWRGWGDAIMKIDDDLDVKVRAAVRQIMSEFPEHKS